jgi:hypothetical protein
MDFFNNMVITTRNKNNLECRITNSGQTFIEGLSREQLISYMSGILDNDGIKLSEDYYKNLVCDGERAQALKTLLAHVFRILQQDKTKPKVTLNYGFDVHGVVDSIPQAFAAITSALINDGHEVHVITGAKDTPELRDELERKGIKYTHLFSITTYHEERGTAVTYDENNRPWMDEKVWNRTKGEYCAKHRIDFHLDDTEEYGQYYTTPFILYKRIK